MVICHRGSDWQKRNDDLGCVFMFLFVCFMVLGTEPRGLHLIDKCSTTEFHPQSTAFYLKSFHLHRSRTAFLLSWAPSTCREKAGGGDGYRTENQSQERLGWVRRLRLKSAVYIEPKTENCWTLVTVFLDYLLLCFIWKFYLITSCFKE